MIKESLGNKDLLKIAKTAFFCSHRCPASVVLRSYDWAKKMKENGVCIISGFHSQIEKDVLHYLLKGNQPIIVALARGLKKRLEPEFTKALSANRLLIVTPFNQSVRRTSQETANKRNELMIQLADEIFVAYAQPEGNVERLIINWLKKGKKVKTFDVEENRVLIYAGAMVI